MSEPPIKVDGLRVNREGALWAGRIVDHAIAQTLNAAGLDDLLPAPNTILQRLIDALDADDGETTIKDEP